MILKELAPFEGTEPFEIAGRRAEERMSFYLKRNFADSTGVHVINDFRFEHNGQHAQIDHLIVHRRGMMVIESKSVTSQVRINEREEWSRLWDGDWKGIPSPIPGNRPPAPTLESTAICQDCTDGLSPRVMDYCRLHPTRFAGRLLCMNCQQKY